MGIGTQSIQITGATKPGLLNTEISTFDTEPFGMGGSGHPEVLAFTKLTGTQELDLTHSLISGSAVSVDLTNFKNAAALKDNVPMQLTLDSSAVVKRFKVGENGRISIAPDADGKHTVFKAFVNKKDETPELTIIQDN